ncbi:restriction endonuclease subunit S [Acinetobacter indicus]|uniref:restriction endonuclease subunit S n=1 Tax=Acinetobacter indicus TaxID=756892 RepID=UPI00396A8085
MPFVRTQNVRDGYFSVENLEYVTRDFHKKNKKSQIFNGDVLIARVGANMGMVCAVENLDTEANCANVIIIKNNAQLNSQYLSLFLNSENGQKQIHSGGAGGAQAVFNTTLAKEISFPYFPLEEQTKIASFLSAVDEKISQLTQKHELLSQYKQGMMQKLFSQQIRFKADDGSEFGEWGKAKVGNITETIFGYPFDSKEMVEDNNGIPLMRGINIGECHIRHSFELDRFFLKDTSKLEKYFVRVNDIVLSMDGSKVGRNSAFVTEKDAGSLLVQRVCILREKENTNIQYVYQWIISKEFHRYVDQVKTSSGIPHISGKQIQDYEISYPCLEEQTKIANFLSAIDQKIEVVTQQIEQAKTWKKGLLQQMFV